MIFLVLIKTGFTEEIDIQFSDIMKESFTADGKKEYSFTTEKIDYYISKIETHAGYYPPKFNSVQEKETITKNLIYLIDLIEKLSEIVPDQPEILYRKAMLYMMGYNLDFVESGRKTMDSFDKLLANQPDNKKYNYKYGVFLVGTDLYFKKGIPYLEKAVQLGEQKSLFSLGMAYLRQGNNEKSLKTLKKYLEYNPEDEQMRIFIDAIE